MRASCKVRLAQGVLFGAALLAAGPSQGAVTFCGDGASGNLYADSVWKAIVDMNDYVQGSGRSCKTCHYSANDSTDPTLVNYVQRSFELDILEEWMKTSYWAPGLSKAEAAKYRMWNETMPPRPDPNRVDAGKSTDWAADTAYMTKHDALRAKITSWTLRWAGCGNAAAGDRTTAGNCIWGKSRVQTMDKNSTVTTRCLVAAGDCSLIGVNSPPPGFNPTVSAFFTKNKCTDCHNATKMPFKDWTRQHRVEVHADQIALHLGWGPTWAQPPKYMGPGGPTMTKGAVPYDVNISLWLRQAACTGSAPVTATAGSGTPPGYIPPAPGQNQ